MAPETVSAAGTGEVTDDSSGGGGSLNGEMPTIDQYTGPDKYYDEVIGRNYQTGLKGKIKGTDKWNKDIKEQAAKVGVNPLLVKVLMATESGGVHSSKPNAYNCVGLMQVQGQLANSLGLNWSKVKSDPVYNIYAGCMAVKDKHEYAKGIIKRNSNPYASYKSGGMN
ncbi:transglycosylase SLT domain-containing protein [Priestia megaterium]